MRLLRRLREEGGIALPTAMLMMLIMTGMGTAGLAYVDGQSRASLTERQGEDRFNLAEGALNTQMFLLSRYWPGSTSGALPALCNASVSNSRCPDDATLRASYPTPGGNATWVTQVRDNPTERYTTAALSSPSWDANHDGKMWVRAQATRGTTSRALVGLVQVESLREPLPRATILAPSFETSNNGNKPIVCTRTPDAIGGNSCASTSSLTGGVRLRCSDLNDPNCLNIRGQVQIQPYDVAGGYSGEPGLSAASLDRLRTRAIAEGTYYATCPPSMTGAVIYVEAGNCSYNSGGNTQAVPGVFIVNNGTVSLGGNGIYWGIIYAANAQNSSGVVVSLGGTSGVYGGVFVDGDSGKLKAGSSKVNLVYYDAAFNAVTSYGTARLVQNRWREIPIDA